jgi:hypothetical protein
MTGDSDASTPQRGGNVVVTPAPARATVTAFSPSVVISQAEETATQASDLARDPRLPPDVRDALQAIAEDSRRTADGIEALVAAGKSRVDRRIAVGGLVVGALGVVLAILAYVRPST